MTHVDCKYRALQIIEFISSTSWSEIESANAVALKMHSSTRAPYVTQYKVPVPCTMINS